MYTLLHVQIHSYRRLGLFWYVFTKIAQCVSGHILSHTQDTSRVSLARHSKDERAVPPVPKCPVAAPRWPLLPPPAHSRDRRAPLGFSSRHSKDGPPQRVHKHMQNSVTRPTHARTPTLSKLHNLKHSTPAQAQPLRCRTCAPPHESASPAWHL